MQAENFYNKIKENLDESDFTPDWSKVEVWQRIEQKTQRKGLSVWWKVAAASIVLFSVAGAYLLTDTPAATAVIPKVKKITATQSIQPAGAARETEPHQTEETEEALVISKYQMTPARHAQQIKTSEQPMLAENEAVNEEYDNLVTNEGGEQEFSYSNITSRNEPAIVRPIIFDAPVIFRPAKVEEKPATTPARRERVAILEIPEEHEDYVIAPKEKRKNRQARLAKHSEKTPEAVETNKSNKVWAFVKQSFRNETMPADSTNR